MEYTPGRRLTKMIQDSCVKRQKAVLYMVLLASKLRKTTGGNKSGIFTANTKHSS